MKKLHTAAFLAGAAVIAATPLLGGAYVSASGESSFHDFSELNSHSLDSTYTRAKIFYTADTVITGYKNTVQQDPNETDSVVLQSGHIDQGDVYTVLIQNSTAKDSKGNPVDVVYRIDQTVASQWVEGNDDEGNSKSYSYINIHKNIYGSASSTFPSTSDITNSSSVSAGDPIVTWINVKTEQVTVEVDFCKKGTYVASSDTCTIATDIDNIAGAMWDFDVPNNKADQADYMGYVHSGNEGVRLGMSTGTETNIYYNKNNPISGVSYMLDDGFAISNIENADFNGIWWGNSLFFTERGVGGQFSFDYSGTSCGIGFIFGSAVPYEMPKPVKSVDKSSAKIGDTVTYKIAQEVPNNYSSESDILAFASLYSNYSSILRSHNYASFEITDTFQTGLKLPAASAVKVVDEKNTDVTANFNISINGQKLSVVAKNSKDINFYGHTFTVSVPATVTSSVKLSPVENTARTIFTYDNDGATPENLDSNKVETGITHTVTARYIDDKTGEEIADPVIREYYQGDEYITSSLTKLSKGYELVKTPDNATGTISDQDIVVVYRYRKVANPKTFDSSSSAFVGIAVASFLGGGVFFSIKRRR